MTNEKKDTDQDWFAKIIQTPTPVEVVDFPMKDENGQFYKVGMKVLNAREKQLCEISAMKESRKAYGANEKLDDIVSSEPYKQFLIAEMLFRSCVNPDNFKQAFFRTPKDVLELSLDVIGILANQYAIVQSTLSPYISDMTEEEFTSLIARINEGASMSELGFFTLGQWSLLFKRLISRLSTLQTSIYAYTSQQEKE